MTLYEFNALSEKEQWEITWNGELLVSMDKNERRYIVYQVEYFYVEVVYNPDGNVVEKKTSFSNPDRLDEYLDQIDISEVFNDRTF